MGGNNGGARNNPRPSVLLEEQTFSKEASSAWLKRELDKGLSSRPSGPASKEFWDQLRDRIRADSTAGYDA